MLRDLFSCFVLLQRRAPEWEHLGVLGPVLRGVVGDTLLVTFKNKMPDNAVSMHSHGMLYEKDSEGSPYYDGLPRKFSLLVEVTGGLVTAAAYKLVQILMPPCHASHVTSAAAVTCIRPGKRANHMTV